MLDGVDGKHVQMMAAITVRIWLGRFKLYYCIPCVSFSSKLSSSHYTQYVLNFISLTVRSASNDFGPHNLPATTANRRTHHALNELS